MTAAILISVRNNSSRLPGKCFAEVAGRPAIDRLVARLLGAREADGVAVATSVEPVDDPLEDAARRLGIPCVRGAAEDKLLRYAQAACELGAELLVVVDGDDLLADPHQIDRLIRCYRDSARPGPPLDYLIVDKLPVGATGFGVRVAALRRVLELRQEEDREVWAPYFTETGLFAVKLLEPDCERLRRPEIRLTLDYPEDLGLVRRVFEHFRDASFSLVDVIQFLDAHPDVRDLNQGAQKRYEENIRRKTTPVSFGR